jgi:hypothetical protein
MLRNIPNRVDHVSAVPPLSHRSVFHTDFRTAYAEKLARHDKLRSIRLPLSSHWYVPSIPPPRS